MIAISGSIINPEFLMNQYPEKSIEAQNLNRMTLSSEVYHYNSHEQLKFELSLRKNIVIASNQLNESSFALRLSVKPSVMKSIGKELMKEDFYYKME